MKTPKFVSPAKPSTLNSFIHLLPYTTISNEHGKFSTSKLNSPLPPNILYLCSSPSLVNGHSILLAAFSQTHIQSIEESHELNLKIYAEANHFSHPPLLPPWPKPLSFVLDPCNNLDLTPCFYFCSIKAGGVILFQTQVRSHHSFPQNPPLLSHLTQSKNQSLYNGFQGST